MQRISIRPTAEYGYGFRWSSTYKKIKDALLNPIGVESFRDLLVRLECSAHLVTRIRRDLKSQGFYIPHRRYTTNPPDRSSTALASSPRIKAMRSHVADLDDLDADRLAIATRFGVAVATVDAAFAEIQGVDPDDEWRRWAEGA